MYKFWFVLVTTSHNSALLEGAYPKYDDAYQHYLTPNADLMDSAAVVELIEVTEARKPKRLVMREVT